MPHVRIYLGLVDGTSSDHTGNGPLLLSTVNLPQVVHAGVLLCSSPGSHKGRDSNCGQHPNDGYHYHYFYKCKTGSLLHSAALRDSTFSN